MYLYKGIPSLLCIYKGIPSPAAEGTWWQHFWPPFLPISGAVWKNSQKFVRESLSVFSGPPKRTKEIKRKKRSLPYKKSDTTSSTLKVDFGKPNTVCKNSIYESHELKTWMKFPYTHTHIYIYIYIYYIARKTIWLYFFNDVLKTF